FLASQLLKVERCDNQLNPPHHRRLVRRPAVTISPIRAIERRQIHLTHGIDHEPRQMIPRKPIPHVRRQKKPLLTPTLNEVLRHTEIMLNMPDRTSLCDTLSSQQQYQARKSRARTPGWRPTGHQRVATCERPPS